MRLFIISLFLVFCSKGFSAHKVCSGLLPLDYSYSCDKTKTLVEVSELELVKSSIESELEVVKSIIGSYSEYFRNLYSRANNLSEKTANNLTSTDALSKKVDTNYSYTNHFITTALNQLRTNEIASLKEEFRIYKERRACPPCVILPANTENEMKKKYHCFKTGIEQWERSEKNFDNKCIGTLVGHIKQLPQLDDGDWFGEDEINYILDLAARYPSFLRIK